MDAAEVTLIPARQGVAAQIAAGHFLRVINPHGHQVVDTWAFAAADLGEWMSMEHSRTANRKAILEVGDSYVTNRRQPVLTVVADTSPGIHDTLIAACDQTRYEQLGHQGPHDNCCANLRDALSGLGRAAPVVPAPLNLFMNIAIQAGGKLEWRAPVSRPGDAITFRVEMDAVAVFSACPMDLLPINGPGPVEARFQALAAL